MARILVTGVNGFVGRHLVNELKNRKLSVVGAGREKNASPQIRNKLDAYCVCDLTLRADVRKLPLEDINGIINLAGLAQVGASFQGPELYKKINVKVLSVLSDVLLEKQLNPRILAISTGAVYDPKQQLPLNESSAVIKSGSPYALSKLAMEAAAKSARDKGLDCIIVRPFNHLGPGQGLGFLVPDLFSQLIKQAKEIKAGDLSTKRDFTDVRDVVKAYCALIEAPSLNFDTYNVCSGSSHSGKELLDLLLKAMKLKHIKTTLDKSLVRPSDPKNIYGSFERIRKDTGWKPAIALEQTIKDFVENAA